MTTERTSPAAVPRRVGDGLVTVHALAVLCACALFAAVFLTRGGQAELEVSRGGDSLPFAALAALHALALLGACAFALRRKRGRDSTTTRIAASAAAVFLAVTWALCRRLSKSYGANYGADDDMLTPAWDFPIFFLQAAWLAGGGWLSWRLRREWRA